MHKKILFKSTKFMHNHSGYHFLHEKIFVFGCGNTLFGDDGFGSEVANTLMTKYDFSPAVHIVDAGTSVRDMLFDILLSEEKPGQIIIVDVCDIGLLPGTIAEIPLSALTPAKISDFSLHQFPTTNLLKEIRDNAKINLKIFVVQPGEIPKEVSPGLSVFVQKAVLSMCETIKKNICMSHQ
jgi:coenzyme F420 hydrogenase subunit delta